MAPRLIDLSRLNERQMDELCRRMKRDKGAMKPRFRTEPADEDVFMPLSEGIARESRGIERIESYFKATKARKPGNDNEERSRDHYSYYLGFLFETSVQMAILDFARENPDVFSVLRDKCGVLESGAIYSADSRGNMVFFAQADGGRTLRTLAEIDLVGELHDISGTVPVIFEITLMNARHRDFKLKRKAELLEEIYGRKPYFCIVRPAYGGEEEGAHVRLGSERGVWREILVPRNDALRSLARRLLNEEKVPGGKLGETALGA